MTFGDTATSIQRSPMRVPRINGLMSGSSRVIGHWASTLDATQPTELRRRSTTHSSFQNPGPSRSLSPRMIWRQSADKRVNPHLAMGHLLIRWILYGQHSAKKRGAQEYQESDCCCPEEANECPSFQVRADCSWETGSQSSQAETQSRVTKRWLGANATLRSSSSARKRSSGRSLPGRCQNTRRHA